MILMGVWFALAYMLKIASQYNFWIGQVCLSLLQPRNSLFVAGSLPEQNQPRGEVSSLPHFGGETELAKPLFRCLCCPSKHAERHQITKKGFDLKGQDVFEGDAERRYEGAHVYEESIYKTWF